MKCQVIIVICAIFQIGFGHTECSDQQLSANKFKCLQEKKNKMKEIGETMTRNSNENEQFKICKLAYKVRTFHNIF